MPRPDLLSDLSWIESPIEEYLNGKANRSGRKDSGWFHPSDLSNQCDSALAFAFLGYQRGSDVDARVQRVFDLGNARDRDWKRYLRECGLSIASAVPRNFVNAEWRIRGECDDILVHPSGHYVIAEIKTINQRGFDGLDGAPLPEHLIQVHCYIANLSAVSGVVIYENKNDGKIKIIPVPFQPEIYAASLQRIVRIIDALTNGHMLDRTCKYGCSYKDDCRVWNAQKSKDAIASILDRIA